MKAFFSCGGSLIRVYSISHEICTLCLRYTVYPMKQAHRFFVLDQTKPKLCANSWDILYIIIKEPPHEKTAFTLFHSPWLMLGCAKIAWTCSSVWMHPVQRFLLPSGDSSRRLLHIDVLKASGHLNTYTNGKLVFRGTWRQLLCHNIDYQSTHLWLEIDAFAQNEESGFKSCLALYGLEMAHGDKDLNQYWLR